MLSYNYRIWLVCLSHASINININASVFKYPRYTIHKRPIASWHTYNININALGTTTSFRPDYDYCHNYSLSFSLIHFMYSLNWLNNKTINKRHNMKKGDNEQLSERKTEKKWLCENWSPHNAFTTLVVTRWRWFLIDCCIGCTLNPYVLNEFVADSYISNNFLFAMNIFDGMARTIP